MSDTLRERAHEFARFFSTSLAGLLVDLSVAWTLVTVGTVQDVLAAACGLFVGMLVGYAGHLRWTFRPTGRTASLGHFAQFACGVAIALVVRITVLVLLEYFEGTPYLPAIVRLGLAAGLSFVASYVLCRFIIFRPLQTDRQRL
jgi:putative flippase GtrA